MRAFVNLLLLFLAVANSNTQDYSDFPPEYFGVKENVLKEEKFFYFDTDILQALSRAEPSANIFISPLSIKTALTMILEGAANESEKEIKNALHLPDDKNLIRKQFRELLDHFEDRKVGVTFKLANRIFVSSKLTPIMNYVEILKKFYFSDVKKVNFSNGKQSADTVNDWVENATHGYIQSIADQGTFSPDTSIFIANALYFKGLWLRSFSEQGVQAKCFYLHNGVCQMSPMMDVVENFKYNEFKQLDAKMVELPYTGNEFSMVILLPNKKDGIHQLARDIRTSINKYADDLIETEVYVTLPKFSIDYSTDLVKYLPDVHIHTLSQPNADLSGLTAQIQGKVSKMLHKARIEVNEQGTVAAAVTGAVVVPLMGNTKPRFRADHPFFFFIRHIPTKTILFEGRVMIPEKAVPVPQNPIRHPAQQRPLQLQPQQQQHQPQQQQHQPQIQQHQRPQTNNNKKYQEPSNLNLAQQNNAFITQQQQFLQAFENPEFSLQQPVHVSSTQQPQRENSFPSNNFNQPQFPGSLSNQQQHLANSPQRSHQRPLTNQPTDNYRNPQNEQNRSVTRPKTTEEQIHFETQRTNG